MASSVVKWAAQQLGNLMVTEAKFLYKVQGDIENLQTELEWIECFLEDADTRQRQEKLVRKWVAQVTDFAYEAEDIIERYLHEVSYQRRDGIWETIQWFANILSDCLVCKLHCLGLDINNLTIKVAELNSRLTRYGVKFISPTEGMAYNAMMREESRTYSHVEEEVVGLENDVRQVVDQLTKTQVKVVCIRGMGGLGKSTLARRVFADKDVKERFGNNCVWVYISKEFSSKSVFEEILIGLGASNKSASEIKGLSAQVLAETIYEVIQNKKCLVVLDDIWTTQAWDSLKPALGSILTSSISKLLLSTRNQKLLEYVDSSGYPHYLKPLDDENSRKLLQLKAFPKKRSPGIEEATSSEDTTTTIVNVAIDGDEVKAKMEKLGNEMLRHCHGLPLAIIALGGILSSKRTLAEWEEVQKNISSYLMDNMGGILPVLELSYQDLPFYLKPCFLYLANFPEDHEISAARLYHLWEAEGILTKDESEVEGVTSYEIGERLILGLIQRSMVQVGKRWPSGRIRSCRVHDLMRDMCIKKCKDRSFLDVLEFSNSNRASIFADGCVTRKQTHRCAIHVKDEVVTKSSFAQHRQIKNSCVRSLFLFQSKNNEIFEKEYLDSIVKSFPLLRVLDLEDAYPFRSELVEVEHLIHLRYLNLRRLLVMEFSSKFWDLKYVITLDLRSHHYMKFPDKFHKMERLRHLYLPTSQNKVIDGERWTFKLDKMETFKNFDPRVCELKDLLQMTSVRVFSIRPDYLFKSKDELELLAETPVMKSGQLLNSLRLGIQADVVDKDPTILGSLYKDNPRFTKLNLDGRGSDEEAFRNLENAIANGVEVFPLALTKLKFRCCTLGRQVILALEKLPQLQKLDLWEVKMGNKLSFSAGSFPQLTFLRLLNIEELEEWEVVGGALLSLQYLYIVGCDKLKKLPDGLPRSILVYRGN